MNYIILKGIPKILSPELFKVLCEMGHSDHTYVDKPVNLMELMPGNVVHEPSSIFITSHFGDYKNNIKTVLQ